jgi:preprotein translocase SecE subunit
VARDRKRTRRGGRPRRPPGARVPPEAAAGFGLPADADAADEEQPLELPGGGTPGSSVFPQLEPFEEVPVSAAASAFGEEPALRADQIPRDERKQPGNRVVNFLRGSWAELQRVQWPDRRQVAQATGVVLGFVVVAGIFLGLADEISQQIVNAIL